MLLAACRLERLVIGAGLFTVMAAASNDESLSLIHVIRYTLIAGLFQS